MRVRRTVLGLSLLGALAVPSTAAAHATLVRSTPQNGDVVGAAPTAVRFFFDDDVRPVGGVRAIRNGGGSVLAGKAHLAPGSRRALVVPLRAGLGNGDYTVLWRALSDDGHVVQGVLAFGVGAGRPPPRPTLQVSSRPSIPDTTSRWLLFAGLLGAAGSALFAFAARQALRGSEAAATRVSATVCIGCVLFVVGGSSLAHGTSWQTRFGASLNVGLIVALIAATLAAVSLVEARARVPAWTLALALVPIPSIGGHALDRGRPWPNVVADVLHVLAASAWLGALLALVVVVPAAARELELERGRVWAESAAAASRLALVGVAGLAVTGVFRAFWELTSVGQLVSTGYGRTLLVKTALLLVLSSIGWLNRGRIVPLLSGNGLAVGRLRRNVAVELMLFVGLVAAVAWLTASRPGRDTVATRASDTLSLGASVPAPAPAPPAGSVVLAQEAGSRAVALAAGPRDATVTVLAPDGTGASGLVVRIDGVPAEPCGAGCYRASVVLRGPGTVELGAERLTFPVPSRSVPAAALVRRATAAFRRQRSVVFREALASSPTSRISTVWRVVSPDRLRYDIAGGPSGIVIGGRRWDRSRGAPWRESPQTPLDLPAPAWQSAARVRDAHLLGETPRTLHVSFVDPTLPAWFDVVLDRRTLLPRSLRMTAAAHFMRQTYLAYGKPLRIRPPAR